jgi:hypothetical protein
MGRNDLGVPANQAVERVVLFLPKLGLAVAVKHARCVHHGGKARERESAGLANIAFEQRWAEDSDIKRFKAVSGISM